MKQNEANVPTEKLVTLVNQARKHNLSTGDPREFYNSPPDYVNLVNGSYDYRDLILSVENEVLSDITIMTSYKTL